MQRVIFNSVQGRYESTRQGWAEHGGRRRYWKLLFWAWVYSKQYVPGVR